jgi:hypothetical protein
VIEATVRGDPDALLIVEFAEEDQPDNLRKLKQLSELMSDLGFGWNHPQRKWGGVVDVVEPATQTAIADFRTSGLNVMMSMKQEASRSPLSRIAPCRCRTSPTIPSGSTPYSPSTAPAAPCMRMPPRAACMCAPSSI